MNREASSMTSASMETKETFYHHMQLSRYLSIAVGVGAALIYVISLILFIQMSSIEPLLSNKTFKALLLLIMLLSGGIGLAIYLGVESLENTNAEMFQLENSLVQLNEKISMVDRELEQLLIQLEKSVGDELEQVRQRILELVIHRKNLGEQRAAVETKLVEDRQKIQACQQLAAQELPAASRVAHAVSGFDDVDSTKIQTGEYIERVENPASYPFAL